jgi:hypothetical protein
VESESRFSPIGVPAASNRHRIVIQLWKKHKVLKAKTQSLTLDQEEERNMRPRVWIASLMFAGIMAGCEAAGLGTPLPRAAIPTAGLSASATAAPIDPGPTNTPRPEPVYATARVQPVNCRFGPGMIYAVISGLDAGRAARVDGRDYSGAWLYVHDPLNPGGFCWVSTAPVDVEGDASSLPLTAPPYVTVTKLDVRVEPQRVTVECDNYPQYALFIAEVTTNGPTLVNWRWELSTGEVSEAQVMLFDEADTQVVQKSFVIESPNDYWGRLHINAPNEIIRTANLVANCTP